MESAAELMGEIAQLEHDEGLRSWTAAVTPGVLKQLDVSPIFEAYRKYSSALERFVECPERMEIIATNPVARISFFRLFGYRGELQFDLMPRVWLRDLPLLSIGRDAHLGQGVILGTSAMSIDGMQIKLSRIAIGDRAVIGRDTIVEGGVAVGEGAVIGKRGTVGEDAIIGRQVTLGAAVRVGPGSIIGEGARIGAGAIIGAGAVIDPDMAFDDCDIVPAGHRATAAGLFPLLQPARRLAA